MSVRLGQELIRFSPEPWAPPVGGHSLMLGASGTGKTYATLAALGHRLAHSTAAQIILDPEGEFTPLLVEFMANPANGVSHRTLHVVHAASPLETFGLGLLDAARPDAQECHRAALRALAVLEQVVDFGVAEFGPRLSKTAELGMTGLAHAGLPLVVLPECFNDAARLRSLLAEVMPYPFMAAEVEGLARLCETSPRQFVDYLDALKSRLLPLFGSPAMRRVFGQARHRNLDLARIIDNREVLIVNLSGLEAAEAVMVGTSLASLLFHLALTLPITDHVVAECWIDECADFLIPAICKGLERTRKRGLFWHLIAQQPTQLIKPNDPERTMLTSVITNTRGLHTTFGGLTYDSAKIIAECDCIGHIELDTVYKPGSLRPVVVGNDKIELAARAAARHHVEQSSHAIADTRSEARVRALTRAASGQWATMSSSGTSFCATDLPDAGILTPATPLSDSAGRNAGYATSSGRGWSRARLAGAQSARAHQESISSGQADGTSIVDGTHEAMVARFANLEMEAFSLEEKIAAVIGLIMNLPKRTCLRKAHGMAPVVCRTPAVPPPFRSEAFRRQALPLFEAKLRRASPYLRPNHVIDAEIADTLARLDPLLIEPDFAAPEPRPRRSRRTGGDNAL